MKYLSVVFVFLFSFSVLAQIPERPNPPKLVNDIANVMSTNEVAALEQKLRNYNDSTSTQIAVITVQDLGGYEVMDFAYRIGETWGVGQKGKNNGIVVLVSVNDHKAAIATGYGMEGAVTDASSRRIRQDFMSPNFRNGDFYTGLDQATTAIMKLASGEYKNEEFASGGRKGKKGRNSIFSLLFILAVIIFPILSSIGRTRRNHFGSKGMSFWTAFWLMGGGRGGGGSGWGGGGSSGGGFGGFGGGGFGGGGSGGSW
jgi:uncharacterized protein